MCGPHGAVRGACTACGRACQATKHDPRSGQWWRVMETTSERHRPCRSPRAHGCDLAPARHVGTGRRRARCRTAIRDCPALAARLVPRAPRLARRGAAFPVGVRRTALGAEARCPPGAGRGVDRRPSRDRPARPRATLPAGDETLLGHLREVLGEPALTFATGLRWVGSFYTPVLQLFRPDGMPVAYAKIGWDDVTTGQVRAESDALALGCRGLDRSPPRARAPACRAMAPPRALRDGAAAAPFEAGPERATPARARAA